MNRPVRLRALVASSFVMLLAFDAGAAPKTKIALLPLEGRDGVNPVLTEVMTEALAAELMSRPNLSVITPKDIEAALGFEKQKAKVNAAVAAGTGNDVCTDNSCLQEIGGALGVDLTVSGTISRLGSSWILTVQAFNPRKAEVVKRHFARVASKEPDALLDSVPEVAYELFPEGAAPPRPKGGPVAQQAPPQPVQPAPQPQQPMGKATLLRPYGDQHPAYGGMRRVPGPGEGLSLVKFSYSGGEPGGIHVRVTTAQGSQECSEVSLHKPCNLTVPAGRAQVSVTGAVQLNETVDLPSNQAKQATVVPSPSTGGLIAVGAVFTALGAGIGYLALVNGDVCEDGGALCTLSIIGTAGSLGVGVPLMLAGIATAGQGPGMHVFDLLEPATASNLPKKLLDSSAIAIHPNGGGVSTMVRF